MPALPWLPLCRALGARTLAPALLLAAPGCGGGSSGGGGSSLAESLGVSAASLAGSGELQGAGTDLNGDAGDAVLHAFRAP